MWLVSGDGWPPRAAWPGILGSGVLWFGLYMITLNWGEREVDAGTAAMVVTIGPILIALLGGWLLREGFPRRLGAGMAVSLAGIIVVSVSESDTSGSGGGRAPVLGVACTSWRRSASRRGWCSRSRPWDTPRPSR